MKVVVLTMRVVISTVHKNMVDLTIFLFEYEQTNFFNRSSEST